jgi:DNA-binding MarR family transcriptional regulator
LGCWRIGFSATALVNRLAQTGLVERNASGSDARRQYLGLTNKANEILEKLSGAHLHEIREMAPELMQALRMLRDRQKLEKIAWMA